MKKNPTDKQKKKRQIEGRLIERYNRKKDTTDIQIPQTNRKKPGTRKRSYKHMTVKNRKKKT